MVSIIVANAEMIQLLSGIDSQCLALILTYSGQNILKIQELLEKQ